MFLLMLILGAMALACILVLATRRPFTILDVFRPRRPALARWAFVAVVGFVVFSPHPALAATGAAAQSVDLSAIWQIVLTLAGTAVTVGVPVLISVTNKHLRLAAGSQAADDLDQALEHGVALALDLLKSVAAHNGTLTLPAGGLGSAVALVAKLAPAAIAELGITPAEIEALITAKINASSASPANAAPAAA